MKKSLKMFIVVAIGIVTVIGVAYAVTEIEDYYRAYGFMADGTVADDTSNTEMSRYRIHFTSSADTIDMSGGYDQLLMGDDYDAIRMSTGDDQIQMAGGNDVISLGYGSDNIRFYGGYYDYVWTAETIGFNDVNDTTAPTSYIKYTSSNDTIEIKSNSGDVIITLGQ